MPICYLKYPDKHGEMKMQSENVELSDYSKLNAGEMIKIKTCDGKFYIYNAQFEEETEKSTSD